MKSNMCFIRDLLSQPNITFKASGYAVTHSWKSHPQESSYCPFLYTWYHSDWHGKESSIPSNQKAYSFAPLALIHRGLWHQHDLTCNHLMIEWTFLCSTREPEHTLLRTNTQIHCKNHGLFGIQVFLRFWAQLGQHSDFSSSGQHKVRQLTVPCMETT